jgi:hypothetical protein
MSSLPSDEIAARVVAWHNRNPLAQRLRPFDVGSVGHVALPFHDPVEPPPPGWGVAGGSLLARAIARARASLPRPRAHSAGGGLRAAFREDFIPPLRPDEVAALAARHGVERDDEPVDAPVRVVMPPPGTEALVWRWLLTAEARTETARMRVLLGPAPGAPVLGRRLLSLPRVVALAALSGAALTLAVTLGVFDGDEPAPVAVLPGAPPAKAPAAGPASAPAAPHAAASAASTNSAAAPAMAPAEQAAASEPLASAASAAAPTPKPPSKPAPAPAQTTASAPPAAVTSRPLDVEPRLGRIELPPIPSILELIRRQAAEPASAALAPSSTPSAGPAAAPTAHAPAFALATRLLRTRTESQLTAEALTALLVVPGSPVQKVEVIKIGDDFRVVAWPYPSRADAERARASLLARGHRLQLIEF